MFVVIAQWLVTAGHEDTVAEILTTFVPLVREEPGCVTFIANRSVEDRRRFVLYERFRDRAAFDAHTATPAFQEYVLGRVVPLLESRVREIFEVVGVE